VKYAAAVLVVGLALGSWRPAHGAEEACPVEGMPWLRLDAEASLSRSWASSVAAHLGLELGPRGIALCLAPVREDAPSPLAIVELRLAEPNLLEVAIGDLATGRRLTRQVPLDGIPEDARPLAIALAADELLRASWLEASIDKLQVTPAPVTPTTSGVVARGSSVSQDDGSAPAPRSRAWLSLLGAGESSTGGQNLGGFDARVAWGRRLEIAGRVGYRWGAVVSAEHGNIESSALLGGISAAYSSPPEAVWGGLLFLRADLARVAFEGQAFANGTGTTGSALTVLTGCGVSGWRSLGSAWRLVGEVSLAGAVRPVAAVDAGRDISALSGAVVGVAFGVSAGL
jgi:hypothetical protein